MGRHVSSGLTGGLDLELWVLTLKRITDVAIVGRDDEPPDGYFTEDGMAYFRPRSDADFARVKQIAQAAFSRSQPLYWRLVYGLLFESEAECEEFALKWHNARMADLGFPSREDAMRAYTPLRVDEAPPWDVTDWQAGTPAGLVPASELPQQLRGTLVGRSLASLPPERAGDVLGYVLAVANAIAVADGLRLSEPDSIPRALDKAVRGIDRGLEELARARREEPHQILDRTRPLDLFRIGATLDPDLKAVPAEEPYADADADADDERDHSGEEA